MSPLDERTRAAIEGADTDELLRIVDGHCETRAWDELVRLRAHCQEAVTRGKQLWAIDHHIRYRLALEAPAEWAGPAVTEGPVRFTPGPLPEVAASTHSWAELEPHLGPGPERAVTAHERVVRGEDLTDAGVDGWVLELPLRLEPWEPAYPVATYRPDRVEHPTPPAPPLSETALPVEAERVDDPEVTDALAALVTPWVEQSNGRLDTAAVTGDAAAALAAIGPAQALWAQIDAATAMAWMAWAGASGGAHGSRRGGAAGRFGAWWAASTLTGLEWPPDPDELGDRLDRLAFWIWSDGATTGWVLRLAIADPERDLAWAVGATDETLTG